MIREEAADPRRENDKGAANKAPIVRTNIEPLREFLTIRETHDRRIGSITEREEQTAQGAGGQDKKKAGPAARRPRCASIIRNSGVQAWVTQGLVAPRPSGPHLR